MSRGKSAGIILHDGESFLIGHATRTPRWDIPKGGIEDGEDYLDAALREFQEETGQSIERYKSKIKKLGVAAFVTKDVYVFHLRLDKLPNVSIFRCESEAIQRGVPLGYPEMDKFIYESLDDIKMNIHPKLKELIERNRKELQ